MCSSREDSRQSAVPPDQQHWRDRIRGLSEGEILKDFIFEEISAALLLLVIMVRTMLYLFPILQVCGSGLYILVAILIFFAM